MRHALYLSVVFQRPSAAGLPSVFISVSALRILSA
jgi:hypothetical protein